MPRRLATQVPQTISRLIQGGIVATPPVSLQALVTHPPIQIPPRVPYPRSPQDLPKSCQRSGISSSEFTAQRRGTHHRDPRNSKKKLRTRTPSLKPKPIVYLEDRVRRQFFLDHPWEGLRPRTIVEQEKVTPSPEPPIEVKELSWWSINPQPEDVISFSVHLHMHHQLSLAHAYRHALAQYHALRAEHETASRYALLEAQAYGAIFAPSQAHKVFTQRIRGPMPFHAAPETYRGFLKETQDLAKFAADAERTRQFLAVAASASAPASTLSSSRSSKMTSRVKPATMANSWTGGADYCKMAQTILLGNIDAFANSKSAQADDSAGVGSSNIPAALSAPGGLAANATGQTGSTSIPWPVSQMRDPSQLVAGLQQRAIAAGKSYRSQ